MKWPWTKKSAGRATPGADAPRAHPLAVPFFADEMPVVVTLSDAGELRRFLNSAAGTAIKSHLSASIGEADAKAVDSGQPYDCGVARGWRECSSLLLSLSRPPTAHQPEQPEFVVAGDEDGLETKSP